jgi:alkanesulfonate monooxygenase SsuD/methylene tetrahydromethanopterin reductase-like flavin-dependent oxidoreductase (luciferase family)
MVSRDADAHRVGREVTPWPLQAIPRRPYHSERRLDGTQEEERATMRFGLFGSAQAKRGGPDVDSAAGYREFIENNVEAEALGYHSTFLVEHHFTGFGQVSATLNLLTWVGARTTTLRLGTAVLVLPWHNPVLLAEQTSTLDLLSGGRLDFGIGKGYRYNEFAGFCIPMEEAEERFDESLEILLKAWTADSPWSHRGKYWQFEGVVVEPPTAQKPHPPLWMGAGSPGSIKKVAELGFNLLLDQYASVAEIGERIALFKGEVQARGRAFDPMSVGVTRSINVVTTEAEREKALEMRIAGRRRIERLAQRPDGQSHSSVLSYADPREAAAAGALYGTPDEIAAKLQSLRDVGAEYVLLNSAGGLQSLRRFARELMPAFAGEPAVPTAV